MNVYELVTAKIVERLEEGVIPWRKCRTSGPAKSLTTGKEYRGLNSLLLGMGEYSSRYWPKPNSRGTSRKVAAPDFAEGRMAKGKRSEQAVRARKWPQTRGDLATPNRKAKSPIGLWPLISLT